MESTCHSTLPRTFVREGTWFTSLVCSPLTIACFADNAISPVDQQRKREIERRMSEANTLLKEANKEANKWNEVIERQESELQRLKDVMKGIEGRRQAILNVQKRLHSLAVKLR